MASGHVFSSGISLSESLVRIGFGTTVLMNLGMELVPGWEEIGKAERVRIFLHPAMLGSLVPGSAWPRFHDFRGIL